MKKTSRVIYVLMVAAFLACLLSDDGVRGTTFSPGISIGDISQVIYVHSGITADKKTKLNIPCGSIFLFNSITGSKINHFNYSHAVALDASIKANHSACSILQQPLTAFNYSKDYCEKERE